MRYGIAALVLLLIWLQYELWFAHGGLVNAHHLHHAIMQQHAANIQAEKRNQQLINDVHALKDNPDVIAAKARHNFGMVNKGETYYDIVTTTK